MDAVLLALLDERLAVTFSGESKSARTRSIAFALTAPRSERRDERRARATAEIVPNVTIRARIGAPW